MARLATRVLRILTRGASERRLERWFGSAPVQRAIFWGMARSFDPRAGQGFEGRVVYELLRPETGRPPRRWTLDVRGGRAVARPGAADDPTLTLRLRLGDFVRIAAGTLDPALPLLRDRASIAGDLSLAARLPEMFAAPRPV